MVRTVIRLSLLVGALLIVYRGSGSLIDGLEPAGWGPWAMGFGILSYALALSVPFVPGVELGIALMLVFGRLGVVLVYFGTLLGLSIAFQAGRHLPPSLLGSALGWLRLVELRDRVLSLAQGSRGSAIGQLRVVAPRRLGIRFARHQYLLLALAINVPGNVVLGGGGGIALLAGFSGRFRYWTFLAVCSVAVAPVPILFFLATS